MMHSIVDYDRELSSRTEQIAKEIQALGLDPYPTVFEIVPENMIYELASYILIGRYSHWSFGRQYQIMKTRQQKGFGRIYETVVNTNTCQAYLLDSNDMITNVMVVAHVFGHSDFFANNSMYRGSPDRMDVIMQSHAEYIRACESEYGEEAVEQLLDSLHSIQEHVDPFTANYMPEDGYLEPLPEEKPKTGYEDLWPSKQPIKPARRQHRPYTPFEPDKDLIRFIMLHSPILEKWQRNIASMIRQESLYFQPNRRTKVSNEGWATLIHTIVLNRLNLTFGEHAAFARTNAGVTANHGKEINPYHLGYNILDELNIRYGGSPTELAPELLTLRSYISDPMLLRDHLDQEMLIRLNDKQEYSLPPEYQPRHGSYYWEEIRDGLVSLFSTMSAPDVEAIDGDYKGSRHLYLRHNWTGAPLDVEYARKTLEHIYKLWGRTVWLETATSETETKVMIYDTRKGHRYR